MNVICRLGYVDYVDQSSFKLQSSRIKIQPSLFVMIMAGVSILSKADDTHHEFRLIIINHRTQVTCRELQRAAWRLSYLSAASY